jgi:hypothetical protein
MKLSRITGSFVLAAGLSAGLFAVPAQADTTGSIDDLLTTLDGLGLTKLDPEQATEIARGLCPVLAEGGQNTADIASRVSDAIGRPLGPATIFTGTAISYLCPKAVENVAGDLANGKLPIPLFPG